MPPADAAAIADCRARYPEVFRRSPLRRFSLPIVIGAVLLYGVYCWWFFSIGQVMQRGSWELAGVYLADWVSWESRPTFDIEEDGAIFLEFPRFSPLGDNPSPDWIETTQEMMVRDLPGAGDGAPSLQEKNSNSFMTPGATGTEPSASEATTGFMAPGAATGGADGNVEIEAAEPVPVVTHATLWMTEDAWLEIVPGRVTITRGDESLVILAEPGDRVEADGPLPDWANQKYDGEKIVAWFGFAGRVEVDDDAVKIWKRFLGWENFIFDTNSPYWGRPAGEVISLIFSGNRLDPDRSNISLAWNNILYNAEWQHLDVWSKLLQTIVMAFVGTLFAGIIAFPLSFIAARNITRSTLLNQVTKRFFDFQRSVDMLIWALFFTRAFGPGPLAGISAIFFTDTGTLGKLYSEALENIDDRQREGVKSVGAPPVLVQRFGVLPQVLPVFASQALYFWESNTRSATIIGAVGAGGIGLKLWEAMRTNQDWENVAYMVILILLVVYVFDSISNALRSHLIRGSER